MVMSAPEEAELAAVCFIDKLEQCKKEENDKVDATTGKKIKRFFPMDKKGVRGGRAFFRSQVSGYLADGLILTFVYWVKDPSGSGYKTKDVRYVMYSKANGGTTTTVSGTSTSAGTSTASSGSASLNLDELVRSKCSGGGCHESGSSLRPYNNLAEAKASASVASRISDGSMPKGRSLSSDEKAALLNALK
jgi:hypothetical protein